MKMLESLLSDNECLFSFSTTYNPYITYAFITERGTSTREMDILGCMEDTLHRMLEAGFSDEEILYNSCFIKEPSEEEFEETYTNIDLGYVLPGEILFVSEIKD